MKRRLASMTKNIDELTDLVKKVSVNDERGGGATPLVSPGAPVPTKVVEPETVGNKRKKLEGVPTKQEDSAVVGDLDVMPDWNPSSSDFAGVDSLLLADPPLPDVASSGGLTPPDAPSPVPSDDAFVDDLFRAFADGDAVFPGMESLDSLDDEPGHPGKACPSVENPNKPCPRLMKRIEDSLSTIPKEMHNMVADRLIDAIEDSQPIAKEASCFFVQQEEEAAKASQSTPVDEDAAMDTVAQPQPVLSEDVQAQGAAEGAQDGSPAAAAPSIPLPLAVATLKTILSEYGVQVECRRAPGKDVAMGGTSLARPLPVVPLHA